MSIHYKFKSTLDFDTITFDGLHISVSDLKKSIIKKKRFGKITDFDLQITNAQTKEEYNDDSILIPKNTSLIISRIPLVNQQKNKNRDTHTENVLPSRTTKVDGDGLDLSKMKGSEEDKILAMMAQSTADYDPKSYQRIRGQFQTGEVPATYRCNKCKKGGHWIKNCTFQTARDPLDAKRNTGIPRSFRSKENPAPEFEVPDVPSNNDVQQEIPEELLCSICHDIFTDAVMIPCCGSSFCDDCVRTALLESEDNECPDCKEKGSSPGSLIPNRFLRNSVNTFRNETGYKSTNTNKVDVAKVNNSEKLEPPVEEPNKSPEISDKDKDKDSATNNEEVSEKVEIAEQSEIKETQEVENVETNNSNDTVIAKTTAALNHEETESDFEDNITVTMPLPSAEYQHAPTRDRTYNDSNVHHPNPPGLENKPSQKSSLIAHPETTHKPPQLDIPPKDWDRDNRHMPHERNKTLSQHGNIPNFAPSETLRYFPRDSNENNIRPINQMEMFPVVTHRPGLYHMPPHPINQPQNVPHHQIVPFNNPYMPPRPIMGFQNYIRPVLQNPAPGYMPNTHPMLPSNSLASVYQSVSAKVGTGIIDDPLDAFNRIMKEKEKEKRKEERRRSPERFRSKERESRSSFRTSPYDRGVPRESRGNRERTTNIERRHEYDHKKDHDNNKRYHHKEINSFSDRSTRSKSRSNSVKRKRSNSPIYKRASRSRSNFRERESRQGNKKYTSTKTDYSNEQPRRGNSRGHSQQQQHHSSRYNTLATHQNTRGHRGGRSRSPYISSVQTPHLKQEDSARPRVTRKRSRDFAESLEPPPPGYEVTSSAYCSNWINSMHIPNKYESNASQDLFESNSRKILSNRINEPYHGDERSRSKSVNRNVPKRQRKSRSLTPTHKTSLKSIKRKETSSEKSNTKRGESEALERSDKNAGKDSNRPSLREENDPNEKHGKPTNTPNNDLKHGKEKELVEDLKRKEKSINPPTKVHAPSTLSENREEEIKPISKDDKAEKKNKEKKKKKKDRTERKKSKKEKKYKHKHKNNKKESCDNPLDESVLSSEERIHAANDGATPEKNDTYNNLLAISNNKLLIEQQEYVMSDQNDLSTDNHKNKKFNVQPAVKTQNETASSPKFNRIDSVLDIHEYETDFDEVNGQGHGKINFKIPEISKWENDDKLSPPTNFIVSTCAYPEKELNEVIVEPAREIFRNVESFTCAQPLRLGHNAELQSTIKEMQMPHTYKDKSKGEMESFQITVPTSNSSKERSVEIKSDSRIRSKPSTTIVKSVKDRLGVKVSNKKNDVYVDKSAQSKTRSDITISSSIRSDVHATERNRRSDKRDQRDRHSEKTHSLDSNKKNMTVNRNNRHGHRVGSSDNYNDGYRPSFFKGGSGCVGGNSDRNKRHERPLTDPRYYNKHSEKSDKYQSNIRSMEKGRVKYSSERPSKNKQGCLPSVNPNELHKRRSRSSSLSENSDTEVDSSYEKSKTKKRKAKKEKKRSRHSSSVESSASARKRNRRNNKSIRKKKKRQTKED